MDYTAELDSFKGSIVDFFEPDTLCTAIKLCDEVSKSWIGLFLELHFGMAWARESIR